MCVGKYNSQVSYLETCALYTVQTVLISKKQLEWKSCVIHNSKGCK